MKTSIFYELTKVGSSRVLSFTAVEKAMANAGPYPAEIWWRLVNIGLSSEHLQGFSERDNEVWIITAIREQQ